MNTRLLSMLCFVSFSLSACNSIDSTDLETSGIYTNFSVTSFTANQTEVSAYLSAGSGLGADSVDLKSGDELVATTGSTSKAFTRDSQGHYIATFPFNNPSTYRIAFNRSSHTNAPNTSVILPAPFEISKPTQNQTFASGVAITLKWSPANLNNAFSAEFETNCKDTAGQTIRRYGTPSTTDSGTITIQPANLLPSAIDTNITCLCSLTLIRKNIGTLDPNYNGGSVDAEQVRTVSILLSP